MYILRALLFFFLLCFSSIGFAQINLDSLNTLLPTSKGTNKVDLLNTIVWELRYSDPDRALVLCNESINLSKAISYTKGEAQALYNLAAFSFFKGDFSKSLEISKKSITLFENINNSLGLAKNWNMHGLNLQRLNDYPEALIYYKKALGTCQLFEFDELLLLVRMNIANMSYDIGDYKKALKEYLLIASSSLEQGDSTTYYNVLTNIAKSQKKLGKYTDALSNYFKIQTFEKFSNRKFYLANNYMDIGNLYSRLGLGEPTREMFEKAIQLYQEIGNRRKAAMANESLGVYYLENEEFDKADFFYKEALQNYDSLDLRNIGRIYSNIAALRIKTNKFDEALTFLNKSLKINQDIGNKQILAKNYANMGAVYFELEQIQKSEQYFLKSFDLATEFGSAYDKQIAAEGLTEIYKQTNNDKAHEFYSSMFQASNDSIFADENLIEINRMLVEKLYKEHKNKTKELSKELSDTKEQLALNKSFFNRYKIPVISFFILLSIAVVWLFKKHKRTSQLNRTLKNKATKDQEKFETSLESKNKQLTLLSLETAQQTDLFKKIHHSLQQILTKHPENQEIKKLEKMMATLSMDQHNWENFTSYFNEVYAGFFDRLSTSFPSITNKELRLCALIRLKIPSYEASIILGISPRSVHKSRYRIRKKMELDPQVNIDEFICSI